VAKQIVVVGPPGTGKTTAMTGFTEDWFKHGVDSREIAYLAFTKAAANEAASRIIGQEDEGFDDDVAKRFPYFRTIHSLAYQGLRAEFPDMRLMTTADLKKFGQWSSMDGTFLCDKWEDLASVYQRLQGGGKTEWDDCIRAYTISRISCRNLDEVERSKNSISTKAARSLGQVDATAYKAFVGKYEAYKNDNGLIDFTDMLVHALTQMKPIQGVKHVVIDEAQDLSPICVALCDRLFEGAETTFWAGDEDQCIFNFSGADANLFIDRYRKADSRIHLRQTHRFGQEVWDKADKIIRRVSKRIPKTVFGIEGRQHHLSVRGEFEPFVGDALILHRHVAGCQSLSVAYRNAGMPFRNERGDDPLGYGKRVENFRTLNDLADGKQVTGVAATEFITEFVPSMMPDSSVRLVTRGAMKKLNAEAIPGAVNLYELQNGKILTPEGAEAIKSRYYNVFDHSEDFEYYARVLQNGYKLAGNNIPVITTMHGSKGRQAEKVVVFSEMSKKCWDDEDSEHRLAFVAMTRTSGTLQVCAQQTVDWAKESYDYPIKKGSNG
jgi:superfamily I DNA/RNA helicase